MTRGRGKTLWERWSDLAARDPDAESVIHWSGLGGHVRWRRGDLLGEAKQAAGLLEQLGVRAGDVCALIFRPQPDFFPVYLGVVALGAIPAVLAYPNSRIHPDKFIHGLKGMCRHSGLDFILTERSLEELLRPIVGTAAESIRGLLLPTREEWRSMSPAEAPETKPERLCLLQHSSGTTGLQKGVGLSHAAVLGHVEAYGAALEISSTDRTVSWLPLYHDMGMIAAFHMALAHGIPLVQLDAVEWVTAPSILLEAISSEAGTLTWLPNFAFNLMADRVHEEDIRGLRLDSLRSVVNCSEPVRSDSMRRFASRFEAIGLKPNSLSACYAMAETTFAVTQTALGRAPHVRSFDRQSLATGVLSPSSPGRPTRECVSSGTPLPGCELEVRGEAGQRLGSEQIGELALQSPWMFDGYRNNPEATARVLNDGWYHSGDLGFESDGEYYVIGRKKDVIIVAGKNIYPEDVEDVVSAVTGISPGRVVALGIENPKSGTEDIWVVAETAATTEAEQKPIRQAIVRACMGIDVTVASVQLVPPRWLIKSSSGKPSRQTNRERILERQESGP